MHAAWNRIAIAVALIAVALPAQGQGKGKGKGAEKKAGKTVVVTSKGEVARKHVSTSRAVIVTRDVLVTNGYQIVNVAPSGTTQVIYYRRGNMGKGRGLGPVQKIYVVPSGDVVRFTSVPDPLLATILRRLGM
jgi:hypothetical protein